VGLIGMRGGWPGVPPFPINAWTRLLLLQQLLVRAGRGCAGGGVLREQACHGSGRAEKERQPRRLRRGRT
jgi:hypothetical protein